MRAESFISPYWSRWRSYFGAECAEGQRRRVLWSWREIRRALWMSPAGLNQGPEEKRLNANMSEVVLPPSRIFVQRQEYTEALVVFFFIPLCDIKHPWRSRYCQTVVQWQVAPSTFLNIILLFIDLSEPPCSSCIFPWKRWCKPDIHVWINVTTMQRTLAVESGKESNYLLWDLQQRCSSEADEQAAVNTAGL